MPDTERIQKYRFRAEELRTIADGMRDRFAKESMTKLAFDYERMAAALETAPIGNAMHPTKMP